MSIGLRCEMDDAGSDQGSGHDPWEDCTWEGNERAKQRAWEALSPAEKTARVEEWEHIARALREARRKMGLKTIFRGGHIEG
jgi:hypothetical protein